MFSHFPSHYIGIVNIMLVTHLVGLVPKALAYLVLSPLQPPRIHHCNKNKTKHNLQPTSGLYLIRCIKDHVHNIANRGNNTKHSLAAYIETRSEQRGHQPILIFFASYRIVVGFYCSNMTETTDFPKHKLTWWKTQK